MTPSSSGVRGILFFHTMGVCAGAWDVAELYRHGSRWSTYRNSDFPPRCAWWWRGSVANYAWRWHLIDSSIERIPLERR